MGQSLTSMIPRLSDIIRSGLEPQLSLKVLQFNALLLGRQVVEPHATLLSDLLVNLTSFIYSDQAEGSDNTMDGRSSDKTTGPDRSSTTERNCIAALNFSEGIMQLFPDIGLTICAPALSKIIASLPDDKVRVPPSAVEAIFVAFSRMLWLSPTCLDEIFGNDPKADEKISMICSELVTVVSSVSIIVMMSIKAQKIMFINQKKAMLSLCSTICRSPRVARVSGHEILNFTRRLLEVESKSEGELDLDALIEASCGTTRRVVGDGPLGDTKERTAEILKADPLLTVSLNEALANAEKAVASV